jgi:hypothetical protein
MQDVVLAMHGGERATGIRGTQGRRVAPHASPGPNVFSVSVHDYSMHFSVYMLHLRLLKDFRLFFASTG